MDMLLQSVNESDDGKRTTVMVRGAKIKKSKQTAYTVREIVAQGSGKCPKSCKNEKFSKSKQD